MRHPVTVLVLLLLGYILSPESHVSDEALPSKIVIFQHRRGGVEIRKGKGWSEVPVLLENVLLRLGVDNVCRPMRR